MERERSEKRQQPFSAPLPAKGDPLVDLSGSDLSPMQLFPILIFSTTLAAKGEALEIQRDRFVVSYSQSSSSA